MTLQTSGGLAALVCAATYLFGFALLITLLAPLGFGSREIDAEAVVEFIKDDGGILTIWNTVIYIVNALALAVLVVAVHATLHARTPAWAEVSRALGVIWATLVIGAGMLANVAVERASYLAPIDMNRAVAFWETLHAVELGLGGGNEIAGGAWIGCVSLAAWIGRSLGKVTIGLGLVTSAGGMLTLFPFLGDVAGAVFGLGAIAWFICIALNLIMFREIDHASAERERSK